MEFVTLMAWIFGILSTLLVCLRIAGWLAYTELDRMADLFKGRVASFPIVTPGVIAIVCLSWVIAN